MCDNDPVLHYLEETQKLYIRQISR